MDRETVKARQLIERYLQGQLSDEETEAFETFYLSDPATLAELEHAERLQQELKGMAADGELPRPVVAGGGGLFRSPQFAAAASVLLVFSLGLSGLLYQQVRELRNGLADARLVPLVAVRGDAAEINSLQVTERSGTIVLLVDPGPKTFAGFQVIVTRGPGDLIWERGGLRPGYLDLLAIGIPARVLTPGDYEVLVQGEQPEGGLVDAARLAFRVTD